MKFNENMSVLYARPNRGREGICVLVFWGVGPADKKIGLFGAAASGPA